MTHLPDGQKHTHRWTYQILIEGADAFFPEIDRDVFQVDYIYQQTLARADRIYLSRIDIAERIEKDTGKEQEVMIIGGASNTDMRLVTFHTSIDLAIKALDRGNLIVTRNPEGYISGREERKNVIMGSKTWESLGCRPLPNNELPWRLPADLANFKAITTEQTVKLSIIVAMDRNNAIGKTS
ncbi:hypothetical protein SPFM20_00224 [Salmonella phage SPFM20]|nr:hypothetical protein SPFM20_00224 [Salmonella phage SPFM20]